MPKIILSGYILVARHELPAIRNALPEHLAETRGEAGCLVFDVREADDDSGRFEVYEEFESREAFEFHQTRARQSEWGVVSKNVRRFYDVQEIED